MKRNRILIGLILLLVFSLIAGEVTFRSRTTDVYSTGKNGLWLRHSWVGDSHSAAEYDALVARLTEMKITDTYFHSGPFEGNGTVPPEKYVNAKELVHSIKVRSPHIRVQAYLGQVEAKAGGPLDLSSESVRANIISTAQQFLDLGFDGIHYDIEPIYSGDPNFIRLLHDTHTLTQSRNKILSVATSKPEPIPGLERVLKPFVSFPGYWEKSYFLQVAKEVDQVAIMAYDSGIAIPFLYGKLLAWTTKWCVGNGLGDVYIGIPTYDETTGGHYPYVESITNALRGLKQGVAELDANDRVKIGAAIYAEWTTSEEEWDIFSRDWLGR